MRTSNETRKTLQEHIAYIIDAHQNYPKKPGKDLRYWDMKTPYSIHPIWCGMTILTETSLSDDIRLPGSIALLYHDILEDTNKPLPDTLSKREVILIQSMTFHKGIEEEMEKIWDQPKEVILLKLYDKTSNVLDMVWMKGKKRAEYLEYTRKLNDFVITHFGNLNITKISSAIIR